MRIFQSSQSLSRRGLNISTLLCNAKVLKVKIPKVMLVLWATFCKKITTQLGMKNRYYNMILGRDLGSNTLTF